MSMDVSRLAIEVTSAGINEAKKELIGGNGSGGLYGAAVKTEKAVQKLTDTMGKMSQLNMTGMAQAWTAGLGQFGTVLQGIIQNANATAQAITQMTGGMNSLTAATQRASVASQEGNSRMSIFRTTLSAMASAFTVYKAVELAHSIIEANDAWADSSARIRLVTGNAKQATAVQEALFESAQNTRTAFEDQVKVFTRIQPAMKGLGFSTKDAVEATDAFSKIIRISGSSTRETQSAMLAFNHTMTEGYMQRRMYNSLSQEAPKFLTTLREELKMTQQEFVNAISKREITGEKIVKALLSSKEKIEGQFKQMPVTVSQAMVQLKNDWLKQIGEMSQDTDLNRNLVSGVNVLRELLPGIVHGLAEAFAGVMRWISENKAAIGEIWDQVKSLTKDVWNLGKGFLSWVGGLSASAQGVNAFALLIYGVRLGIAGIQDGFTAIAGAVAYAGGWIAKALMAPLSWVENTVGDIIDNFKGLLLTAASAADKLHMTDTAKNLRLAFAAADGMSIKMHSAADDAQSIGDSLISTGDEYFGKLANGKGAVAAVLNEEKAITEEKKKQNWLGQIDNTRTKAPSEENDKALKALESEAGRAAKALADAKAKYIDLAATRAAMLAGEVDKTEKVGPEQKELNRLMSERNELQKVHYSDAVKEATLQASLKDLDKVIDIQKQNAALERNINLLAQEDAATKKVLQTEEAKAKTLEDEANKQELNVAAYGQVKGAVQDLALAQLEYKLLVAQSEQEYSGAVTDAIINAIERQIAAQKRLKAAAVIDTNNKAYDDFYKLIDPKKMDDFGTHAQKAFGKMGQAIGGVVNALDKYNNHLSAIAKMQLDINSEKDMKKKAKMEEDFAKEKTQLTVETYADMAGAAQGFFAENSRGYKIMGDIEKGFRIYQMAMQLEQFVAGMFQTTTLTTAKVIGNEAVAASAASAAPVIAAANLAAGTTAAAAGVANQASGDPYSAFPRMAAMAAIMAALGFAVTAGSGGSHSADRQAAQGRGTVLGDAAKQSESISNAISGLKDNSDIALSYSQGMLSSLQAIQNALEGVTSYVLRNNIANVTGQGYGTQSNMMGFFQAGVTTLKNGLIHPLTTLLNPSLIASLHGFGYTRNLMDSGLQAGPQTVGNILDNGFQGSTYQDIQTKKKALFVTYSTQNQHETQAFDPAVASQFTDVVKGMVDVVSQAATALGMDSTSVSQSLARVTLDLGQLSLKGLSADEVEKQLEAAFSTFGDQLATAALGPTIGSFQKAGEGLLETAVRVAGGVDQANYELEKLGLTAIKFTDIINKQGDVGAEIVRQTIMQKEAGTGIGSIIQTLQGTAGDIAGTYKSLLSARESLRSLGIAQDVTTDLIRAAGGLDAMQQSLSDYSKNYFSDAERQAMAAADLQTQFAALGVQMPASKEALRALVTSLSASGPAGQELALKIIALSGAFNDLSDSASALVDNARSDLTDAYDRESQAINDTMSKMQDFTKSLGDFKQSLLTGDLSTGTPLEKYDAELAHYNDVQQRAMSGDQTAIAEYQQVAQDFLTASRDMYASGDAYSSDYQRVLAETDALQQYTSGQVNVAQQQLDALNAQVSGLITVNDSVLTVAQAIVNLQNAMAAANLAVPAQVDGSHADGLSYVPFNGYVAELHKGEAVLTASENREYQQGSGNEDVCNELRNLRAELAQLRAEQAQQTGALITSNFDAHEQTAQTIATGTKDAAQTSSYNERAKVNLA